jgi:hypothetical protein
VFDWLFEGMLPVYLTLATVGVLFLGLWWRDRKKHWLIAFASVVVLIGLYFLLDRLVETPREQIRNSLQAMERGVKERNSAAIFAHVSEQFDWEGLDKQQFAELVERVFRNKLVDEVTIIRPAFDPWPPQKGQPARVVFDVTPKGGPGDNFPARCEAEFVRDSDGKWRLKTFKAFNRISNEPLPVRNLIP